MLLAYHSGGLAICRRARATLSSCTSTTKASGLLSRLRRQLIAIGYLIILERSGGLFTGAPRGRLRVWAVTGSFSCGWLLAC